MIAPNTAGAIAKTPRQTGGNHRPRAWTAEWTGGVDLGGHSLILLNTPAGFAAGVTAVGSLGGAPKRTGVRPDGHPLDCDRRIAVRETPWARASALIVDTPGSMMPIIVDPISAADLIDCCSDAAKRCRPLGTGCAARSDQTVRSDSSNNVRIDANIINQMGCWGGRKNKEAPPSILAPSHTNDVRAYRL
jgi:hypothetical protein